MESSAPRHANRSAVLWALLQKATAARVELASATSLSAATVSRVVDGLVAEGLARDAPTLRTGRPGRRTTPVELVGEAGTVVGIDLGGSNCRMLAVDLLGNVQARVRKPTPARLSTVRLAAWVAAEVAALVAGSPLRAVSLGLPGVVDGASGKVRGAPNLPQVEGLRFVSALRDRLAVPVSFENDANLALLGEIRLGAARGHKSAVMFTIGAGLGAGVVVENRLLRGRTGLVGEFGYLPAGEKGETLEQVLSARGLLAAAAARGRELASPEPIFAERVASSLRAVRERFEQGLLLALVAVTTAYEPEVVVLGGGVASSLDRVLGEVGRRLGDSVPNPPELRCSAVGDLAGAVGAVISALHESYIGIGVDPALLDGSVGPGLERLAVSSAAAAAGAPT